MPTQSPEFRPVTLKASQFILPLTELPISGLKVVEDQGTDAYWRRYWDPVASSGARYGYVLLEVTVYPRSWTKAQMASDVLGALKCEAKKERGGSSSNGQPPTTAVEITAPSIGDASHACGYGFADGTAHLEYATVSRNVLVFAQVGPYVFVSQTEATDQAVAIARRQIEVLERVAPRQ